MRRVFALSSVIAAAVAVAVACGDEYGEQGAGGSDAAAPDGTGGNGGDGGLASDVPPDMVEVKAGALRFAIDRTEVTADAFLAYREQLLQSGGDASYRIPQCAFKTSLGPGSNCSGLAGNRPIACVDWCDAFAYCAGKGKRLCGKIGGGPITDTKAAEDPAQSQWMRACTNGFDTDRFPYGDKENDAACNVTGSTKTKDVGSYPGCVGGVPGLFDMSGNVGEWEDACDPDEDAGCTFRGGSSTSSLPSARCDAIEVLRRNYTYQTLGFRCCKDL